MNTNEDNFVTFMKGEFKRRKERNAQYSHRAFARDLDMDPSNLTKILSLKTNLGEKLKKKIALKLGIKLSEVQSFVRSVDIEDINYKNDQIEHFSVVSDWYHYAFLELITLKKYAKDFSIKAAANDLGIDVETLIVGIRRLEKLKFIRFDEKNNTYLNIDDVSSSILQVATSSAHRKQQKQFLEKAIDALETIPVKERSQSSMTMAIDKQKLPEALEMIKDFRRHLAKFLNDSENLDEVFQLSVSLFPLTYNECLNREV